MFFGALEVVADKIPLVGGLISGALGLFCLLGATVFWFGDLGVADRLGWSDASRCLDLGFLDDGVFALVG
jgi:hypothetical protein